MNDLERAFYNSPFYSRKHKGYFDTYHGLLDKFRGVDGLVVLEIGVLEGGSLFMWQTYFPGARIIGVDLNPSARKWEQHGFEIYIGNQADPIFWSDVFAKVGQIDILIDDGGHSGLQQSATVAHCLPNIRDGGILAVEDTHTSYQREFGGPSKWSFTNSALQLVHGLSAVGTRSVFGEHVKSVSFFTSVVAFHIGREGPSSRYLVVENEGKRDYAGDFRYRGTSLGTLAAKFQEFLNQSKVPAFAHFSQVVKKAISSAGGLAFRASMFLDNRRGARLLRRKLGRLAKN